MAKTKAKPEPADGATADGAETPLVSAALWPFPANPGDHAADPAQGTVSSLSDIPWPRAEWLRQRSESTAEAADAAGEQPPPDRIRADAISLYTDPTLNVVQQLDLHQVFESPFNPRKHYSQPELEKLADTIRGVGVMQPILARPITLGSGFTVTVGGVAQPTYEIIFGHRRYRAAKLAGETHVPAIVRELTDAQSAQLQAIENVQREPLDAIDEALGYQHYIQAHGITKDQLAEEIGLSRTHIYSRLKLLNAVPLVREAVQAQEIGSEVALLIARIHTPKLQEKALAAIKAKYYDLEDGGKKSYRSIRELLREKFTLNLKEAVFDPSDPDLLPLAGSCTTCPKRAGNAPEYTDLTQDHKADYHYSRKGEPNLCTDPDCFEAKHKAHLRNKAAALEARGKLVIDGNKARAAITTHGEVKGAYIALKDVKAQLAQASAASKPGKAGKGKKAAANEQAAPAPDVAALTVYTIQDPRTGKTVDAVKIEDVKAQGVAVKEAGPDRYAAQRAQAEAETARRNAKAATDTKINCALLIAVRQAAALVERSAFDLQMVAQVAIDGVGWQSREMLAKLYGFSHPGELEKKLGQMGPEQLTTLMLDCALVDGVNVSPYQDSKPDTLLKAAKHYGVDVAAIRKDITARAADLKTEDLFKPAGSDAAATQGEPEAAEA